LNQHEEGNSVKKHRVDNSQRGLGKSDRKPKDIIDRYIIGARDAIKGTLKKFYPYQKKRVEPPDSLTAELEDRVRKLHFYTLHRIRRMHNYTQEELKWLLDQEEAILSQYLLSPDLTEPLAQDIRDRLTKRLKANLAWKMQKLRNNDHPFWQKEALNSLANLNQLGVDTTEDTEEVYAIIDAYERKEERRISKLTGSAARVQREHSNGLGANQENPVDEMSDLEKVRATADHMAEISLRSSRHD
jgi:hypothetical protein